MGSGFGFGASEDLIDFIWSLEAKIGLPTAGHLVSWTSPMAGPPKLEVIAAPAESKKA